MAFLKTIQPILSSRSASEHISKYERRDLLYKNINVFQCQNTSIAPSASFSSQTTSSQPSGDPVNQRDYEYFHRNSNTIYSILFIL